MKEYKLTLNNGKQIIIESNLKDIDEVFQWVIDLTYNTNARKLGTITSVGKNHIIKASSVVAVSNYDGSHIPL